MKNLKYKGFKLIIEYLWNDGKFDGMLIDFRKEKTYFIRAKTLAEIFDEIDERHNEKTGVPYAFLQSCRTMHWYIGSTRKISKLEKRAIFKVVISTHEPRIGDTVFNKATGTLCEVVEYPSKNLEGKQWVTVGACKQFGHKKVKLI